MLALRLSVFALACLAINGTEAYIAALACTLAAFTLYAYTISNKILLVYCRIAASVIWSASAASFIIADAPTLLTISVIGMSILDGFYFPVSKAVRRGLD